MNRARIAKHSTAGPYLLQSSGRFMSFPQGSEIQFDSGTANRTNLCMLQVENPAVTHCLRRASECERLAETAMDDNVRDMIGRIAASWRSLSQNLECIAEMEALLARGNTSGVKYREGPEARLP